MKHETKQNHNLLFKKIILCIPHPFLRETRHIQTAGISELKIRQRRDSTTADLVEGAWGEVAVAMARKIALRKLARRRVVVAPFPVEV